MVGFDIGIDLGTTKTIIYEPEKGVILSEPSVAAYNTASGKMIAAGKSALQMVGRNPESITVSKPMQNGVISDYTTTEQMLRYFVQRVCGNTMFKPKAVVCVPSIITGVDRRTIMSVVISAGVRKVCIVEEPLAAAFGAGIDITSNSGSLIVDIGGGTTDIAVITQGMMALTSSIKTAGNALDQAIIRYVRGKHSVLIGEMMAESIKKEIGCAYRREDDIAMVAKGRNFVTGMPEAFEITSSEVYEAIEEPLSEIFSAIQSIFEQTPPELVGDIFTQGILLTGGGALLTGLDKMISKRAKIKASVVEDPVNCVARGTGNIIKSMDRLRDFGYDYRTREISTLNT